MATGDDHSNVVTRWWSKRAEQAQRNLIVQSAPWTGSDAQLKSFQEKVQTYVSYAVDGPMTTAYPETQGLPWRIVLHAQTGPPDKRTADTIATLSERLSQYGGEFETRLGSAAR